MRCWWVGLILSGLLPVAAAPTVNQDAGRLTVTGDGYRATFQPEQGGLDLELKTADGTFGGLRDRPTKLSVAAFADNRELPLTGLRTTWEVRPVEGGLLVSQRALLDPLTGGEMESYVLCADAGLLFAARTTLAGATVWSPPRIALDAPEWDHYLFWSGGTAHAGRSTDLAPTPAYAGISPWGPSGDTVTSLDPARPGLIVGSTARGQRLGVVLLDYPAQWTGASCFFQRHTAENALFYPGFALADGRLRWAWLAPIPEGEAAATASVVEALVREGERLTANLTPDAPPIPAEWRQALPDFPAELRRPAPVSDIRDAVVYTVNEDTNSGHGVDLARKVGSDVLVRGWFKWAQAPPVQNWRDYPPQIHALGALFGGGITCSALYDGENGLSQAEWQDMATRGPAGQLIDAWDQPGTRHGSLSNPKYLDYLFRWCREQIDAGADYLFMDELNAALGRLEGYDDHSLADFRTYLLETDARTKDWAPDDARWKTELGLDAADRDLCPDGTVRSLDYRAWLRLKGCLDDPTGEANPLAAQWLSFRRWRDARAWTTLAERIRAYAAAQGRTVYLSGNGLAPHVDLQVLGVWGNWRITDGHIDFGDSQLATWRSLVLNGQDIAGGPVPVVLFHDWGFGDPPFPWLAVPPSERELWMRLRGAEIYAAGAYFAYPVLGPFGCDASLDGTLGCIQQQTEFYQRHRDLYHDGRYLGSETVTAAAPELSLAVWSSGRANELALHVINRRVADGKLAAHDDVTVRLPVSQAPQRAVAISPDFPGERPATCETAGEELVVHVPSLEAYTVVLLSFAEAVDTSRLLDPVRVAPVGRWEPATRREFPVDATGRPSHAAELNAFLQGRLHTHLANSPTFLVDALAPGTLRVHIQAVAAAGSRLEYRLDDAVQQTVDLPDKDGKNDGNAAEYDQTFEFPIPAGRHRITLDNVGGDWCTLRWYEFRGSFSEWGQ